MFRALRSTRVVRTAQVADSRADLEFLLRKAAGEAGRAAPDASDLAKIAGTCFGYCAFWAGAARRRSPTQTPLPGRGCTETTTNVKRRVVDELEKMPRRGGAARATPRAAAVNVVGQAARHIDELF